MNNIKGNSSADATKSGKDTWKYSGAPNPSVHVFKINKKDLMPDESESEEPVSLHNIGSESTKSLNFVGNQNCSINVYEEGRAIEILKQKEALEQKKLEMVGDFFGVLTGIAKQMFEKQHAPSNFETTMPVSKPTRIRKKVSKPVVKEKVTKKPVKKEVRKK